ncbi:MAG TPA: BrnT family toxin [Gammaproteobacteria bacterium]|nr:BrnT family toxin [Gammaproteobacteria bacterium]
MDYEWDPRKAAANERKHGVTFEEASEVFADDHSSTVPDPDNSLAELRYVIFGRTRAGRELVVAFTERGATIRIINARLMTRRERLAYEQ